MKQTRKFSLAGKFLTCDFAFPAGTLQKGIGRRCWEREHHGNGVRWQAAFCSALWQGDGRVGGQSECRNFSDKSLHYFFSFARDINSQVIYHKKYVSIVSAFIKNIIIIMIKLQSLKKLKSNSEKYSLNLKIGRKSFFNDIR